LPKTREKELKVCLFEKKPRVTQGGLETSGKNNRNKIGCVAMRRIIFEFLGAPYKTTTYQLYHEYALLGFWC